MSKGRSDCHVGQPLLIPSPCEGLAVPERPGDTARNSQIKASPSNTEKLSTHKFKTPQSPGPALNLALVKTSLS
jgi:hypothetical protein